MSPRLLFMAGLSRIVHMVLAIALAAGCASGTPRAGISPTVTPPPTLTPSPTAAAIAQATAQLPTPAEQNIQFTSEGHRQFVIFCAACHGVDGRGTNIAPAFHDRPKLKTEFIRGRVRAGPDVMSAFTEEQLPERTLDEIIKHVQSIGGADVRSLTDEQRKSARAVYREFCTECHGPRGEGKQEWGPSLQKSPPLSLSYIAGRIRTGKQPEMPAFAAGLIDDELLELLIVYVQDFGYE